MTSADECRQLVDRTVETFGALDVLVNNAGVSMMARFDQIDDLSLYERLMKVNYLGCVYPTHFALPHLKKSRGQIVVMSSLAGLTGVPTRTGYCASKHAVFGFFDSLPHRLDGSEVSVTIVAPYFVLSEIHPALHRPGRQGARQEADAGDKIATAEECAALTVAGMESRRRLVVTNWAGPAEPCCGSSRPASWTGWPGRPCAKGSDAGSSSRPCTWPRAGASTTSRMRWRRRARLGLRRPLHRLHPAHVGQPRDPGER